MVLHKPHDPWLAQKCSAMWTENYQVFIFSENVESHSSAGQQLSFIDGQPDSISEYGDVTSRLPHMFQYT